MSTTSMLNCPQCGVVINGADPYNSHICSPRPVSSQLQRIEDGLDKILQNQAALGIEFGWVKSELEELKYSQKESDSIIGKGLNAIGERLAAIEQQLGNQYRLYENIAALRIPAKPLKARQKGKAKR